MSDYHPLPASAEAMLAEAREITHIDIDDSEARELLGKLVESVNTEACLSEAGALDLQQFILRSLCNRLRMLRDLAAHPEITDEVIKDPVIVCGTTRTGSTKTQKLLAATGDFNYLKFWQSLNPALVSGDRSESPAARIQDAEDYVTWFNDVSPNARLIHELKAEEPEEESFMLAHSLATPTITGMINVPSFVQWILERGIESQFEFLKTNLQYLQWQGYASADKRWLLKNPFYTGLEPLLLKAFPTAKLIMTHRNPVDTMPSTCSLFTSYRRPYSTVQIDSKGVLAGASIPMQMHLAVRANHPDIEFLDINYLDVLEQADDVLASIYQFIGEDMSEAAAARVKQWELDNPIHKKGKHKYTLEEFGLNEALIEQYFGEYLALLKQKNIA